MRAFFLALLFLLPLAGCLEKAPASEDAPVAAAAAEPAGPWAVVQEGEARVGDSANLGVVYVMGNVEPAEFDLGDRVPRKATLVATWAPSTPLSEEMVIRFSDREGNGIEVQGVSPVVIALPGDVVADAGTRYAVHGPTDPGVVINQAVHFELILEYG